MSTPKTVDPGALLDQIEARTAKTGHWPSTAELGEMRHDNHTLVAALRAVLEVCETADTSDRGPYRNVLHTSEVRAAITVHLGGAA